MTNATEILRDFMALSGLSVPDPDRALFNRAFDLWEAHPKLEFSDAVIAARCEHGDFELASFDRHFDRLDHLRRWQPTLTDTPT